MVNPAVRRRVDSRSTGKRLQTTFDEAVTPAGTRSYAVALRCAPRISDAHRHQQLHFGRSTFRRSFFLMRPNHTVPELTFPGSESVRIKP